MRVWIGTMESGEADFPYCLDAIQSQTHPDVRHFVVYGRSEPDAHRELYSAWNAVKDDFDLFMKVDADTVLAHPRVVADFVALFEADAALTGVQAWLNDYMTDGLIFGMACIRNTVNVSTTVDQLYCDRVDTQHRKVIRGDELPSGLVPAGFHCHHASDRQAFRYGLHRALKGQRDVLDKVRTAYSLHHDRQRIMALLGAQCALRFGHLRTSYADHEFLEAFAEAQRSLP